MIKVSRHCSKSRYITTSIFKVHTPTSIAQKEAKDVFYEQVQKILDKIPKHDIVTLMVDWNAKVGDQQDGEEGVTGHHRWRGERSENGQHFVEICASNHMVIASYHMVITTTLFPHKYIHKHTWVSQGACTKNQFMMLPGNCKPRRARPRIWYRVKRRSYTTSCISCRSKNKYWRTGKGDWWWNCQRKATLPNAKIGEA